MNYSLDAIVDAHKGSLDFMVTKRPQYPTFSEAAMFLIRGGFRCTGFDGLYHYFTKDGDRMRVPDIANDYKPEAA